MTGLKTTSIYWLFGQVSFVWEVCDGSVKCTQATSYRRRLKLNSNPALFWKITCPLSYIVWTSGVVLFEVHSAHRLLCSTIAGIMLELCDLVLELYTFLSPVCENITTLNGMSLCRIATLPHSLLSYCIWFPLYHTLPAILLDLIATLPHSLLSHCVWLLLYHTPCSPIVSDCHVTSFPIIPLCLMATLPHSLLSHCV